MSRLVMGCDPHLDSITTAVVNPVGTELESLTVSNSESGWRKVADLARHHRVDTVGIEGASGYGRRLAQTLTAGGFEVREVPTRVTASQRHTDGTGKTDPGDARTIARAVARGEGNPWSDNPTLETIRVLSTRRDHLVAAQTADTNQLRALITRLDPVFAAQLGRLRSTRSFQPLLTFTIDGDHHTQLVIELIHTITQDCLDRLTQIRRLDTQLEEHLPPAGHALTTIPGCGVIVAAQLLAQLAGTNQFTSHAKLAAWAGTAPLDASSGRQQRHRLNRGGNRQANRALHTIIISQTRHHGQAHHYIQKRITEGKTRREAIRAAKRHLTRRIWKTLHTHQLT